MRAFIVLALVALAQADVGGYNYAAGLGGAGGAIVDEGSISGGSISGGSIGGGSIGGGFVSGGSIGSGLISGGSYGGGLVSGGSISDGLISGGLISSGGSYGGGLVSGGSISGGSISSGSYGGGLGGIEVDSLSGGSLAGGSLGGGLGGIDGVSLGGGSIGGGSLGVGSLGGIDSGSLDGGSFGGASFGGSAGPASVEYSKEFYSFNAPEAEFEDGKQLGDLAQSLKKNLRVIFIRAPEGNRLSEAALNLAKSAVESRTAIYVLTKQSDISELANKLQSFSSHTAHKPEVHFVKYRTNEDAANAQHAIQQQYNNLPGVSQNLDGGVAPVLDFASKAVVHHGEGIANGYIPPAVGGSIGNVGSVGSVSSVGSLGSLGSVSSVGSVGSIGSVGSVGSPSSSYLPIVKI